jgi:hypothetical protein
MGPGILCIIDGFHEGDLYHTLYRTGCSKPFPPQAFICPQGAIPLFQYPITPINCERSERSSLLSLTFTRTEDDFPRTILVKPLH